MAGHIGIVQNAMQNLKLGDGMVEVFHKPFFPLDEFLRDFIRNPAVAFAKQSNEVWSALAYFIKADREHLTLGFFLIGDSPSQINFAPHNLTLLA